MQESARRLGISLAGPPLEHSIHEAEYRRVLGAMSQEHLDGLIVSDTGDNVTYRRLIVSLAEVARLPTVYPYRTYFDVGRSWSTAPTSRPSNAGLPTTLIRFSEVQNRVKFRFIRSPSLIC